MLKKSAPIRFFSNSAGLVFQILTIFFTTKYLGLYQFALWGVANSLVYILSSLNQFGYKSQLELNNNKKNDEIGVVIGSNGEIIKLEDKFGGTHRFALCKLLEIKQIIVSVKAIHKSLLEKSDIKKVITQKNNEYIVSLLKNRIKVKK